MRAILCEEPRAFARGLDQFRKQIPQQFSPRASFDRRLSSQRLAVGAASVFFAAFFAVCRAFLLPCARPSRLRRFWHRCCSFILQRLRGICRCRERWLWCNCRSRLRPCNDTELEKILRHASGLRAHRSATDATRTHAAHDRHDWFRCRSIRCRRRLELTLDRRCSGSGSDFVIASALAQVDHIRIVRIVENANEVALAETFAVTAEDRAR